MQQKNKMLSSPLVEVDRFRRDEILKGFELRNFPGGQTAVQTISVAETPI